MNTVGGPIDVTFTRYNPTSIGKLDGNTTDSIEKELNKISNSINQIGNAARAVGAAVPPDWRATVRALQSQVNALVGGSSDSFFRLNDVIGLTGSVLTEQVFFSSQGSGSRSIPPAWWQNGGRLSLFVPANYALDSGSTVMLTVKVGATALLTHTFIQPLDEGYLVISAGIKDVTGTVVTLSMFNDWQSGLDGLSPSEAIPADIVFNHGGLAQDLQVSATFSVVSITNSIQIRNVNFSGAKAPVALT